jgi:hypothetical protein
MLKLRSLLEFGRRITEANRLHLTLCSGLRKRVEERERERVDDWVNFYVLKLNSFVSQLYNLRGKKEGEMKEKIYSIQTLPKNYFLN